MQRSGRTSLTRPTCYRRTLAQVIERGYPSIRMTANGLARPCSAPRHGHPNAWHIGLELANVALTQRDLHRSLLGVREKSLIRKCSVNPRSSPEITKNRHFRVRVLHGQPRSPVSRVRFLSLRLSCTALRILFPHHFQHPALYPRFTLRHPRYPPT